MIKLIVSDLDGTLLRSDKTYSEKVVPLIDELRKHGVIFAIATGRAVHLIQDIFPDFLEKGAVICENGSALLMDSKLLHRAKMAPDQVHEILAAARNVRRLYPILCGTKCGYAQKTGDPKTLAYVRAYVTRLEFIESLEDALSLDDICKISLLDGMDPFKNSYPQMRFLDARYHVIPSGGRWLDVLLQGEDKGSCLRRLQEITGISPDETMCFGDFMNDVGLMENCRFSYAMKNAHPDFKKVCAFETRFTNDEDGVLDAIMETTGIRVP